MIYDDIFAYVCTAYISMNQQFSLKIIKMYYCRHKKWIKKFNSTIICSCW